MIELLQEERPVGHLSVARIKVLGVGGAGGNTLNCMIASGYQDVEFIAVNTDAQALQLSKAHQTIQIGQKSTKGLGAGANPEVGKRAAEEDIDKVLAAVQDADIVFLTGGLGGGTGSGALPIIARTLRENGILTIVVVTKPFAFEGRRRSTIAEQALENIKTSADTLLVIPNQNLLQLVSEKVSMIQAFDMINEVLNQSVKGVSDIITRPGHINVDFADVREIMKNQGIAVMGTGRASGPDRAQQASLKAISSPLLENMSITGARGVLLNITGNSSLSLHEISAAASVIYEQADPDANIILGSVIDDSLDEEIFVTVIATGFNEPVTIKETPYVNSQFTTPQKRDAHSTLSSSPTSAYKSPHPISENKNAAGTPVQSHNTAPFIRPIIVPRPAPVEPREEQPARIQPIQEEQKYAQPERQQHTPVQATPVEIHREIHPAPQEIRVTTTTQAHAQKTADHTPEQPQAAQLEQVLSPEDKQNIEIPAYLRKDQGQNFNWNKYNKKYKKHKFQ